ncbi:MAG: glycosyl transferase, partial [Alphaproteobacteria bacterium]|nr:glycosyl transferase [Alphaproteobacteria bacterium]
SDWRDARSEHAPGDEALLEVAAAGIADLNRRYAAQGLGPRFFLLHRRRVWNTGEERWIGWERKRGKLHELNRLARGATDTTFIPVGGIPPQLPPAIHYVLTLDADTRLPIGAARRLVGKMAHPLNRPVFDPACHRVVTGHGILQPRVTPSLPLGEEGSLYQRVFSGPDGLDPYAFAVSDVYQDLFEEGSYSGKGIYDLDVFEAALEGQIAESTVLSHDLLEGIFARAGLASDIEVVEEFPSRYGVAAARQHRWVRGDWQLLPWIFGFGSAGSAKIPMMGRWKLLDNLRRSLSAPAAVLALLIAWLQPLSAAALWTVFIVLTIALPPLVPSIAGIIPHRPGVALRNHFRALARDVELALLQCAFLLTFLAHQAWLMVDAVARTLWRLFVKRKRLLEWVTAAEVNDDAMFDPRSLAAQIGASLVFGIAVVAATFAVHHGTWPIAVPFVALWVVSPVVARWASLAPPAEGQVECSAEDAETLRLIARRTWRFFESFVTPADNMLPPDNFQEDPKPVLAHRTSPTNIGLYLLSILAARDFGWIGAGAMADRLEATFATLDRMERFRGHFYNWYETEGLKVLEPRYISSVDSGNLAGHLIALANACRQAIAAPVFGEAWTEGIADALGLVREAWREATHSRGGEVTGAFPAKELDAFAAALKTKENMPAIAARLHALSERAEALAALAGAKADEGSELGDAIAILRQTVAAHLSDAEAFLSGDEDGTALKDCGAAGAALAARLAALAERALSFFRAMEFGFLYDPGRQLLSIGYRGADGSLDGNFYDLLASEARLASFIAIAKGDVPARHWFHLGRTLTPIDHGSGLISWSGSMFEYLMPSLVMRAPAGSLIEHTNRLVVRRQEEYGKELGVPWGISESQFYARDLEQTYQYSSFGVPDLGYKRGLADSTVIAPYASGLAAMVDPAAAAKNYARMAALGARGRHGWYEAIDFTRSRLPEGAKFMIVRAFMAHHQAMTIVAIANAVLAGAMRARFHAEPMMQATELLLQERIPRDTALAQPPPEHATTVTVSENLLPEVQRHYTRPHSRVPRAHLLSNGRLTTMITAVGSGYTRWRDIALTRWREDPTRDPWGSYIYLRDVKENETWSVGYQPTGVEPDSYDVTFSEARAEFSRSDGSLTIRLEIAVSTEDDAEVRRVSITNHGLRARELEVTSYAELALCRQADDVAHPAFAKMFVETSFVPELGALLATRRRRSDGDPEVWAAHLSVVEGATTGELQYETDRAAFLGRGKSLRSPAAMSEGWPLSNSAGAVLDPVFSLRHRLTIPRGGTARIAFWTIAAPTREEAIDLADKHHDTMAFERATTLAWTQAQMQLYHLGISTDEAHLFQRLANHVLYSDATLRPPSDVIKRGAGRVSMLWALGISGDLPIVLATIADRDDLDLVRQLLRAHEYWRLKQLAVDLVILNDRAATYVQDLQNDVDALVRMNRSMPRLAGDDARGGVYVLRSDLVSPEVRALIYATARAALYGDRGSLAEQINRARDLKPATAPPERKAVSAGPVPAPGRPELEFFNGFGGFAENGREYLTVLEGANRTPAPWINVIANEQFGFTVSTEGSGFTWAVNSQQNQLTPWSNDAVGDPPGEVFYLRDEETGEVWTPTALPIRQTGATYSVRHGQGYSRFEHASHGLGVALTQFVPVADPVKICRLKLANLSGRERWLSLTAYVEWVLGQNRSATAPYVVTSINDPTGAIFAQNAWHDRFGTRVAFADMKGRQMAFTCDRTEFVGRDGGLERPVGLVQGRGALSGRVGAGLDPCAALQSQVWLGPADTAELVFFLGQESDAAAAQALIEKYREADLDAVFAEATRQWDDICGTVQVTTPDRALDILLNRWLPYQTLSCRIWARTGFYQASGAYGFRDQLQDVLAVCVARPDIARAHLLRAAARQFPEGDVQHWWLPESGTGIRTRITDDRVWLAFAVASYVQITGDAGVLDEEVAFLEGPVLRDDQHDAFFQPQVSSKRASLFEHCALALDKSLGRGTHGLPLMGTGDWNDGMDRVGEGGKGESVWLGWFLASTLTSFAALAERRGDSEHAAEWRDVVADLKAALEREAWDGDWYRRAFFDDGTPLGSVTNAECRIDSIAQSWAVISRGAEPSRAARAMAAFDKYLLKRDEKLALLFTPPFDHPQVDPGYIKGYPKGVRENGGQYTHAAAWAVQAFAMLGDGDKAGELLSLLNPVRHGGSPADIHRYKVDPYVIAADIYSEPPHVGRGGWTWYTGSAGWIYRVSLEWLLGFRVQGANLVIDPCIPRSWPGFEIAWRHRSSRYDISVGNPLGVSSGVLAVKLDGRILSATRQAVIPLVDDGATHKVQIVLGRPPE